MKHATVVSADFLGKLAIIPSVDERADGSFTITLTNSKTDDKLTIDNIPTYDDVQDFMRCMYEYHCFIFNIGRKIKM